MSQGYRYFRSKQPHKHNARVSAVIMENDEAFNSRPIPFFHRPFAVRQPPHAIPLQPLPSLATNFAGYRPPVILSNSLQVDHNYVPHHRYDSRHSRHQGYAQPSPAYSGGPPSTPRMRVTSIEQPEYSDVGDDKVPIYTLPPWLLWVRRMTIQFFVDWWMLEILSWSFSAICMAIIICILIVYDGHGIPTNWPLGVTINGLISVFSNIAKSALLLSTQEALGQLKWNWFQKDEQSMMDFERIDMASRGPYGALLLLIRTKGTKLTSVGALIVILALPLELFFQQIVTYPPQFVPSPGMFGTIPRALTYNPPDGTFTVNGTEKRSSSRDITAFSEPVFLGNGTVPGLNLNCPTSNCTWAVFDTLAVCSSCTDLSQELQWSCATAPADWLSTVILSDDTYPNITACGYWYNNGNDSVLMSGYEMLPNGTAGEELEMRILSLTDPDPTSRQPVFGGTLNFKNIRNPILDFLISGTPDGSAGVYANKTPTLNECVLYWCVKTVQSSFEWGRFSENTTKTVPLESPSGWPWVAFVDSTGLAHNRYEANFSLELPARQGPDLVNEYNSFTLSNLTMLKTILLMDEIAPSYVTAPDKSSTSQLRWLNGGQFFFLEPQSVPMSVQTNPWLPPNDVGAHTQKLADTMTAVIRNSLNATNKIQTVSGTAWDSVTLVRIRWGWVTLPIGLLLISLVFLIVTVIKSSQEENVIGIWKTSVIAVLFNGLGEEVQSSVAPNSRMGEMRAKAKKLKVSLHPD